MKLPVAVEATISGKVALRGDVAGPGTLAFLGKVSRHSWQLQLPW